MTIANLARAFRYAVWAGLATMLVRASEPVDSQPGPQVLYVGFGEATSNVGYAKFRSAASHLSGWPRAADVRYLAGDRNDLEGLGRAITLALRDKPAVTVVPNSLIAEIAMPLMGGTPLVFNGYSDPVHLGLVESMDTPGKRATGIFVADLLDEKRLELLVEAVPGMHRIAVMMDRLWTEEDNRPARLAVLAARLGVEIHLRLAEDAKDVRRVMGDPSAAQFDGWYLPASQVTALAAREVIDQLRRLGKPAIFGTQSAIEAGGHMAYTQDISVVWDTLADLTARVLNGEDPGTIPIERPRRFILSVRTGPETNAPPISAAVIRRADRIY